MVLSHKAFDKSLAYRVIYPGSKQVFFFPLQFQYFYGIFLLVIALFVLSISSLCSHAAVCDYFTAII